MSMAQKEEINLLAPKIRQARIRHLYGIRLSHLFWKVMIGIVFVAVAYGSVWVILQLSRRQLTETIAMNELGSELVEKQVRTENSMLLAVQGHREQYPPWILDINEALRAAPAGVEISHVFMDSKATLDVPMTLVIEGRSSSRAAILDYQKILGGLTWVESIEAPLQNLASGDQVDFSFTLSRRSERPTESNLLPEGGV